MRRMMAGIAGAWLAAGAAGHLAAADMKIAVVDMEQVLAAHPDTKEAETLIQKQVDEFETEKNGLLDKFEKMRKGFDQVRSESENKALSEEGRLLKRKDAERKLEELRDFDEQVRQTTLLRQKQIKDRKNRMRQRIVDDIRSVVRDYAQKNGYALVLDSGPVMDAFGVVVYSVDAMSITEPIAKLLAETRKATLSPADLEKTNSVPAHPASVKKD
jgi:outer membrane protein